MQLKNLKLNWAKHQKRWFAKWHLYLGIFAGLIVSVVGATGSILVFQDEIDHALNPALFTVLEQQHKIPLEEMIPLIRQRNPAMDFEYLALTDDTPTATYRLYDQHTRQMVYVNPYNGEICGKRIPGSSFIVLITQIHRTIMVPVVGRYIVGISSLILLILTISGIRLWIPKKWNQLKSVLTINFRAGFKRQNYDWHNILGFYSSPVVALLSLTGFCITFSIIVVPLLFILNGQAPKGVAKLLSTKSVYKSGATPLSPAQAVAIGKRYFPKATLQLISLPDDSLETYQLSYKSSYIAKTGKAGLLIIDQYSGKTLLNTEKDFPNIGHAYMSWLTPLHYGSFGGMGTKILAAIAGLIPLILFVTGFIIWWLRYKKQRRKKEKENFGTRVIQDTSEPKWTEDREAATDNLSLGKYIRLHLKSGIIYALWSLLVTFLMGGSYGLISGIFIQPAVFAVIFTGVLTLMNFIVAIVSILFNLIFLAPFKRGYRPTVKYFIWSFAFILVFIPVIIVINRLGLKIF